MSRIFCIVGKSGSGKDTLYHKILSESRPNLIPVIPYTTRPKRSEEEDGVNYFYVTEKQLEEYERQERIIEKRQYQTVQGIWSYFTVRFDIQEDCDYLLITTLEGVQGLLKHYDKDLVHVVYLNLDEKIRLLRCIERESQQAAPDYAEVCRRYLADQEDFSPKNLSVFAHFHEICTDASTDDCLKQWNKILEEEQRVACDSFAPERNAQH